MWVVIGPGLIGFAIGLATGMSKTPGTTSTALKVIAVLLGAGGLTTLILKVGEQAGLVIGSFAIGFSVGIILGALLRSVFRILLYIEH